ncbi:MAG: leucyl aminopeptidase [Ponticaulis sp.]|nr:leucyl aminopeptidase [Ponticaulis sp.]
MPTTYFLAAHDSPIPIDLVTSAGVKDYLAAQSEYTSEILGSESFGGKAGELVRLPDMTGKLSRIVFGLGKADDGLGLAALSSALKGGVYRFDFIPDDVDPAIFYAAWADGAYKFDRYKARPSAAPQLVITDEAARTTANNLAASVDLLRDLVNTPAQDMSPSLLQAEIQSLADEFGAKLKPVIGDDLLDENYPMIHAVGRAADDEPRLLHLSWGKPGDPKLAIVGKGITFDTGGLDLKTGGYMRLMKKDMGGSAHAIGLARLVMAHKLPVFLNLYIPAAENAIGAGAFRPGDILASRKGLTVEIDNTDAEGRLVLADALTRAQEDGVPDLMVDFATLTGAARVAMGPEVAPFYTDDDALAEAIATASGRVMDPAWRMPMWMPYESMLKSDIADCQNSARGPMGGSITAALFLKKFVEMTSWVHWDVWAWRNAKYGNAEGAAAQGLRAMFEVVKNRYS